MKSKIFLLCVICFLQSSFVMHPLKMSVGDVSCKDKNIYLKFKFFTDDLESTLQQFSKGPLDMTNNGIDANYEKWIKKYIPLHFSMDINGVPVKWIYKKSYTLEEKEGVVFVEYIAKCDKVSEIKSVKVKNTLLFDGVPEQKNIVNLDLRDEMKVLQFENGSETSVKEVKYD